MKRSQFIAYGMAIAVCAGAAAFAPLGGGNFDLSWNTIDGGGEMFSAGGDFELSATIGQPDSGAMTGGDFEMTTGFWFPVVAGDCNADGTVDLFDYDSFQACVAGPDGEPVLPDCACFDFNGDDDVDLTDFSSLQLAFQGS